MSRLNPTAWLCKALLGLTVAAAPRAASIARADQAISNPLRGDWTSSGIAEGASDAADSPTTAPDAEPQPTETDAGTSATDEPQADLGAHRFKSARRRSSRPRQGVQVEPVVGGQPPAAPTPAPGEPVASPPSGVAPPARAPVRTAARPAPPTPVEAAEPPRPGDATDLEVLRDHYPNGQVKLERQVRRDAEGDPVNHGRWIHWDDQGHRIGRGQFQDGAVHGHWVRVFQAGEGELFQGPLFRQFQAPFTASADFHNGRLDGVWKITDARGRLVSEWHFADGQREGMLTWWYPSGRKWREVEYHANEIDGPLREWNAEGQLITDQRYLAGRRWTKQAQWYPNGKKRSEGQYLLPREVTESTYDFWNGIARIEITGAEGELERHGQYAAWFPTGQTQVSGTYHFDQPEGEFTWWHGNGQIAARGLYSAGAQVGQWNWWDRQGQLASREQFGPERAPHLARNPQAESDEPTSPRAGVKRR